MDQGSQYYTGGNDQNHNKDKEMQEGELVEEALQKSEKREAKGKGERERFTQLNAEFWRIARRVKKPFLSEQCKEIEENNRMGKTRVLFKKTGYIKRTFHSSMGMIKDRKVRI